MQAQTLAFAFLAALYPVGLLAVSLLLSTERPLSRGSLFYAGAVSSLLVVGTLVITVLHAAGMTSTGSATSKGGFRLALGAAMLVAARLIARRPARPEEVKAPSWQLRLGTVRPAVVFATGAVLYSPSGSYLGAVQQIATSEAAWPQGVQLLVVIAITLLTVEIPLLAYALRPDATSRQLHRAQGWIERHGRQALTTVLVLVGGYLAIDGIITLTG